MAGFHGTVGQLLIDDALPEAMKGRHTTLDKKGLANLFGELARDHPDQYVAVSKKLSDLGRAAATASGGYGFGPEHMRKGEAGKRHQANVESLLDKLLDDDAIDDETRLKQIVLGAGNAMQPQMDDVYDEAVKAKNPIAMQVLSGARGNKMNMSSLLGSDMLYADHRDNVIPLPVTRSYSQGLTPEQYWAGTYGARKGVLAVKFATRDAGYLSKQLNQIAHRLVVTDEDEPNANPDRGLPVDVDDPDNEGALLSRPVGPYARDTVLTPKILQHLRSLGESRILVRSPSVGSTPDGGIYARDAGIREYGTLPGRGEVVGLTAAQALSEPLSQSQLCLAQRTLVRMADWSVKRIEKIRVGDWVMGSDRDGNLFPVRVVRCYRNGVKDCVRTTFREAKLQQFVELISTVDHKLLGKARYWNLPSERTEYGMFPVGEKCTGLSAAMPRTVTFTGGKKNPYALLLGILLGDGCYTVSVDGVYWSCYEPSLVTEVRPYLATLNLEAVKLKGHEGYYRLKAKEVVSNQDPTTGRMLPGLRNPAMVMLHEMEIHEKYAHEKSIPEEVWEWDQESVSQLIGGLFATDGSVYPPTNNPDIRYINFSSTSLRLAEQVRDLLRIRFAVHSSSIGWHLGKRKRRLYSFTITRTEQVRRFADCITIPDRKGQDLAAYAATLLPDQSAEYYHRKTQEAVGSLPTYDIEVDHPDHLFVLANGLIVSNSAKHKGGVAGQDKGVSGFKAIDQTIQTPKTFKGGAAHSDVDGRVEKIVPAPAGGNFITIDGQQHYVSQGYNIHVKPGDEVEAGDVLSEGLPNPAAIVKHKGIGEGRRYFVKAMQHAMTSAGIRAHRRNLELLARGLIDHVSLEDETDDNIPGDILSYSTLERNYKPRTDAADYDPQGASGKYLERPVLHYTIGTKVRPSVIRDLKQFGIKSVHAHTDPPGFAPEMIRGMSNVAHDPDWQTRLYGSGQKASLLNAVHHGSTSDEQGTSFVPGLARAVGFGRTGLIRQPLPGKKPEEITPMPPPPSTMPKLDVEALKPKHQWGPFAKAADTTAQIYAAQAVLDKVAAELKTGFDGPIMDRQPEPPKPGKAGLGASLPSFRAAMGPLAGLGGTAPGGSRGGTPQTGGAKTSDIMKTQNSISPAPNPANAPPANPFMAYAQQANAKAYQTILSGSTAPQMPPPTPQPPPLPSNIGATITSPPAQQQASSPMSLLGAAAGAVGSSVATSVAAGAGGSLLNRAKPLIGMTPSPAVPLKTQFIGGARNLVSPKGNLGWAAGMDALANAPEAARFLGRTVTGQGANPDDMQWKLDMSEQINSANPLQRAYMGGSNPFSTFAAAAASAPAAIDAQSDLEQQHSRGQRLDGTLNSRTAASVGQLAAKLQQGIPLTPGEQNDYTNWKKREMDQTAARATGMDSGSFGSW